MKKAINTMVMAALTGGLVSVSLMGCASKNQSSSWFPFGVESRGKGVVQVRPSRKTAESYYRIGLFYLDRKELGLAAGSFREAVAVDPAYFEAYNSLGVCFDGMKMYKEAVIAYQDAIRIHPERDEVHNNLGYSQLLQGDFDAAITSFTEAISLSQHNNRRYYNNLGLAYTKKGLYAEAYRAFWVAGGEEKARRNVVALAPSPEAAQKFLLATNLDAATNYQSGVKPLPVPGHANVMAEQTAPQQSMPDDEESLTSNQQELQQTEPFVVTLPDSEMLSDADGFLAGSEAESTAQDSLPSLGEKREVMTTAVAPDHSLSAQIPSDQEFLSAFDNQPQQEIPICSIPSQEFVVIAKAEVVKELAPAPVVTQDSPKVATRPDEDSLTRSQPDLPRSEPFVVSLPGWDEQGDATGFLAGNEAESSAQDSLLPSDGDRVAIKTVVVPDHSLSAPIPSDQDFSISLDNQPQHEFPICSVPPQEFVVIADAEVAKELAPAPAATQDSAKVATRPDEDSLTRSQPELPQTEPFVVSLPGWDEQGDASGFVAGNETEGSAHDSFLLSDGNRVAMTTAVVSDHSLSAPIPSDQEFLISLDSQPQQEFPLCSTPPQEFVVIADVEAAKELAPAPVATQDSAKVASRPVVKESFVIELASSVKGGDVAAAKVGRFLSEQGFAVHVRAHRSKYYGDTIIYYSEGSLQEAYKVAQKIPGYQLMQKESGGGQGSIGIRVVLGEDTNRYFRKRFVSVPDEQKKIVRGKTG